MIDEVSNAFDAIRSSLPIAYLVVIPVLVLVVSPVSVVNAAHEFTAYRMQQYDLQGINYGCQYTSIQSEARTLESTLYERRCVFIHSNDLTMANYNKVMQNNPSSILILINNNMTEDQAQSLIDIEDSLLKSEPKCPVYFANEDDYLKDIYAKVTKATRVASKSALQTFMDSATFVGYHLTSTGAKNEPLHNHQLFNIQGVLLGYGVPEKLPTISIVAHYDSSGVAPLMSYGANSGASGVIALLEIARVLGKLYNDPKTHPRYNVLFLLASGGKFNYIGSRKWLEEALDNTAYSNLHYSSSLLPLSKLTLCLDTLASKSTDKQGRLHMHVSKPPKEGSVAHKIYSNIKKVSSSMFEQVNTSIIHKKISIINEFSAWEHEKFSKRRLHAVTLSALATHDDPIRKSILDKKDRLSVESLNRNIQILIRSIIRTIFDIDENATSNLGEGDYSVQKDRIVSWVDFLSSHPRPQQYLSENHIVVTSLKKELSQHLTPSNVYISTITADKRDPEFTFYSEMKVQVNTSVIRSALFDLYLLFSIIIYISLLYLIIMKFDFFLTTAKHYGALQKVKVA